MSDFNSIGWAEETPPAHKDFSYSFFLATGGAALVPKVIINSGTFFKAINIELFSTNQTEIILKHIRQVLTTENRQLMRDLTKIVSYLSDPDVLDKQHLHIKELFKGFTPDDLKSILNARDTSSLQTKAKKLKQLGRIFSNLESTAYTLKLNLGTPPATNIDDKAWEGICGRLTKMVKEAKVKSFANVPLINAIKYLTDIAHKTLQVDDFTKAVSRAYRSITKNGFLARVSRRMLSFQSTLTNKTAQSRYMKSLKVGSKVASRFLILLEPLSTPSSENGSTPANPNIKGCPSHVLDFLEKASPTRLLFLDEKYFTEEVLPHTTTLYNPRCGVKDLLNQRLESLKVKYRPFEKTFDLEVQNALIGSTSLLGELKQQGLTDRQIKSLFHYVDTVAYYLSAKMSIDQN
jgi:hypothetical protein